MRKKIFLLLIGVVLIISVVFLGIKSANNNALVVPFGLACALIAPVGISCITSFFNIGNNEIFKKLLKVPQIDELIQKAETQEEKIKLLEDERKQLRMVLRSKRLPPTLGIGLFVIVHSPFFLKTNHLPVFKYTGK